MDPRNIASPPQPRFEIVRRLGAGGFGSVFVASDRERGEPVALKRLERLDPTSVYRFKQEFRALADVSHRNLVKLHELFSEGGGWSFSMELVDGVRFDEWVRGQSGPKTSPTAKPTRDEALAVTPSSHITPVEPSAELREARSGPDFDQGRLRAALDQLVLGVTALHGEGILHRDLKPSNVLVDRDGRVVILDFGMVATGVVDAHESVDGGAVGTPAYMSPEQARGAPLTVASDWYAVGLMLYEVLAGHLPFGGTAADILSAKTSRDARDPRKGRDGLPDDLVDLCLQMLQRDPAKRPPGQEIMRRLGIAAPSTVGRRRLLGAFVGRHEERAKLHRAFESARKGNTVVAHVHGPSGHGKSTLIRHFLSELSLHDEVVVLDGRCYERESLPFKALDDLVDGLYRYLRGLRPVEAATFMPRHAQALVRLFPALGRLDFMLSLPGKAPPSDPHELRRKAFAALREMFARLTDIRPVALFIDDAQWGDSDSAALFRDLLAPPDVPPLLLIVGYRDDAVEDNELLKTLRSPRAADSAWETVDLPLGPLTLEDSAELASLLLDRQDQSAELARTIARESGGSPLFVAELARRAQAGKGREGVTLQRVVADRIALLPDEARLVLDIMACSERPLDQAELEVTAGLGSDVLAQALDQLRDEHLVNVSNTRGRAAFEILHDKMRLAVQSGLAVERTRDCHARLAETLASQEQTDPETLAYHFTAAGDVQSALKWTERAAERAMDGVAFDHAVQLLKRARAFAQPSDATIGEKLAKALAHAGRGAESAEVYLSVAEATEVERAEGLRQAAAEQYLRSGHVEEALATFGPLLADAGLALPATPLRALVSLLWLRLRLRWRGLEFTEREESECDPEQLRAIDFCWSVGTGLAGIDLLRSSRYYVMSLLMSLRSGNSYRIARSLSIEALMKALESTEGVAMATELSDTAYEIAKRIDNPHALGWATAARAVVAWGNTDLPNCLRLSDEAIASLRQRSLDTFREIGSMQVWFALNSMLLMGQLKRLAERAPATAREAEARGDRYTLSTVRAYILPYLWLSRDNVDQARKEAEAAVAVWPDGIWYHQHWAWLRAMCFIDLYEGDSVAAYEKTKRHRPDMKRAMQLRVRTLRSELHYIEGRCMVDMMVSGKSAVAEGQKFVGDRIERLLGEDNALASLYADILGAGLSAMPGAAVGDGPERRFAELAETSERLSMPLHAAAAELRRAELVGGPGGARLAQQAQARLSGLGVRDPARYSNMLVPRISLESRVLPAASGVAE
jgi:serine/threonine protein kinase